MSRLDDRRSGLGSTVRIGLAGIGPSGRAALFGLVLSAIVAVLLGFLIPAALWRSLLAGEMDVLTTLTEEAERKGVAALLQGDLTVGPDVVHLVDHRLLGGRTVRVKIIDRDGTIVYSDAADLIGQRFPLTARMEAVFGGTPNSLSVDRADPENVEERGLGDLFEFILPVHDEGGVVVGLLELYEPVDRLSQEVQHLRHVIWIAIGTGLGLSALFTASLTLASGRAGQRTHRQTEMLLEDLLRAEESERKRVVGALHNEVGQPLYRILFGLQATRRHLGGDHADAEELEELERLARGIDRTLRSEFNLLYRPVPDDVTLASMIEDLVSRVSTSTSTIVNADIAVDVEPNTAQREAIYRAAEEALANIARHAHAGSVWVAAKVVDGRLVLTVEDDGVGTPPREGIGLMSTRERLEAIGGGLSIRSRQSVGTLLTAWVPYEKVGPS